MKRSNVTTKYLPRKITELTKAFKAEYKKENEETFKGNVVVYLTVGVIERKGLPEIEDTIRLIKVGNIDFTDDQAEQLYARLIESDDYCERGNLGIFCDACKDLCIDMPLSKQFTDIINTLEDTVIKKQDPKYKLEEMRKSLDMLQSAMNKVAKKEEDVKEEKEVEAAIIENELGTKEEVNQE